MTLEEKLIELQSITPPLSRDEIIAGIEKFKASQPKVGIDRFAEEAVKREGVVEQTDATVTPNQTPEASESEDTVSQSEQPSSVSLSQQISNFEQKIKSKPVDKTKLINDYLQKEYEGVPNIGEVVTANDYQYKYQADVDEEGNLDMQVLYKGPEDEDFVNASERARNKPTNIALQNAEASILSQLGFLPEEIKEQAVAQMQPQQTQPQDFDQSREGTQSFDDVLFYDYETQGSELDREIVESEAEVAKIKEQKAQTRLEQVLEESPDARRELEKLYAENRVNYEKEKAEIQIKIDNLPAGNIGKLKEYQKELSDLEEKYSRVGLLETKGLRGELDKVLTGMQSEIISKSLEAAAIKPEEQPSMLNLYGKALKSGGLTGAVKVISRIAGDALDPVDKDLLIQQDFYKKAKEIYANKNGIDVDTVTDEDVFDIVRDMYIQKFTEEEKTRLYEDLSKEHVNNWLGGTKSFKDIFGDEEKEQKENLLAAYKDLDLRKEELVNALGVKAVFNNHMEGLDLINRTYSTEEEAAAAREKLRLLALDTKANINIVNNSLDSISEKVKTTADQKLFANLYQRNYGFLTELGGRASAFALDWLVNGSLEVAARFGVPDLILASNPIAPNPILAKKLGIPTQGRMFTDNITSRVDGLIETINEEMRIPKTFSESWANGDWRDWGSALATSAGQQIPVYAVLFGTGGAGLPLIGLATTGSKFREMQKEIDLGTADYNIFQMYATAILTGGSAVATEYVTKGMLKRLKFNYKNNFGFKEGFNETLESYITGAGRWAKDMGEEIPSEMLDQLVGNFADKYILEKEDVNLFDGLGETAFSTLWTAGVFVRAPLIGQQLMTPFRSKQSFQIIGENTAKIKELMNELNTNKNLDVEAVNQIKDQINQLTVDSMKSLKIEFDRLDKMTDAEKKVLLDNKSKEYEIKRQMKKISENNSYTDDQKKLLLDEKGKQLYNVSTSSVNILAKYVLEENKQKNMPTVEQDVETIKKYAGEDNVTVLDTEEEFAERTGKPKDVDAFIDPETGHIFINKSWAAKVNAVTAANHELLHKIVRAKMSSDPAAAVQLVEDFKNILNDKELSIVQKRIDDNYRYVRDENGVIQKDSEGNPIENDISEYAEEYLTAYSDAIGKGEITWSDNLSESFLRLGKKLINFLKGKGFDQIEFKTGRDVYNFIRDYQANIQKGKLTEAGQKMLNESEQFIADRDKSTQVEDDKLSITKRGQEFVDLTKEGIYNNEDLVNIINSPSSNQTDRFGAMDAVVENNWPVISKGLKFNPTGSIPMDAIKTAVTEQMQGIFPGRNKELLADFNADTAQVNTYLGSLMRQRQAEILERAKQIGGVTQEGTSIDSEAARQVVAKAPTTTTEKEAKVAKKPTETVEFSQAQVEKIGAKDKAEVEAKVTKATNEAFKGQDIKTFGQTRNVPKAVADIYAGMFGLNPQTITDKTRNYQKTDSEGLTTAKQFLLKNANNDFARLPKTKDGFGKGTFLPRNVMNALYTNGKLTGTLKDYMDLIRQKPTKPIYRDAVGQTIRGLLNLHIRNRMFEDLVPTTPERLRGGAKFSITQAQRPGVYTAALGEQGVKVMRTSAEKFAKDNNIKVEFEGEELTVNNFKATNPKAVEYLKRNIENEMWKYIPLESLTRGTMIDYSSKGNAIFFNSEQFDNILKNAEKNRKAWLDQGNTLSYNIKEVNVAKAAKSPSVVSNHYSKPSAQRKVDDNYNGVKAILQGGANAIKADPANYLSLLAIYGTQSVSTSHLVRNMAVDKGASEEYIKAKRDKSGKTVKEHVDPSNDMSSLMYTAQLYDDVDFLMPVIEKVYFQLGITETQDNKLVDTDGKYGESYNYKETQTQFFYDELKEYFKTGDVSKIPNALVRYFNPQVNRNSSGDGIQGLNSNNFYIMGKSVAEMFTRQLPKSDQNSNNIYVQNELTYQVMTGEITQAKAIKLLNAQINSGNAKVKPSITNNNMQPDNLKFSKTAAGNSALVTDELNTFDKALAEGRKVDKPVKKIRVFDFDDTLARSNSKVIVINPLSSIDSDMLDIVARRKFKKEFENLPSFKQNFNSLNEQQKLEVLKEVPGGTKEINATQFAEQAATLEEQGATFDFTQFEQVIDGEKGPLFDVAKKIADTRGTEDLFILTARPQSAAGPIKAFMKALGINIPLGNITGLADGTAAAKGRWIAGKAADGYNDFYFADDASKNVKAVKDVLDQIDVKSRVQQAKFSKTEAFDRIFNDIIEKTTGIESYKDYSAAKAKTIGASKGRFDFLIPPSAEDFVGLLYKTLSKGKVGDAQMAFYKDNLLDPYNKAEMAISQAKVAAGRDYKELKKQFKNIPKTLEKETGIAKYSYQHAIRTYIWNSQGLEVPGLSKRDQKRLTDFVKADPELQAFADQLISLQKGKPYPKPNKDWTAGNITTDVISGINKVNRAEYLQEWQENVDIIFSEKNMNKLEAAFGAKYVEALKDSLRAMKSGSNRPLGGDRVSNQILDWLNNSVGAIMFLNTRSAVLQTISAVNFINWGDNNILKAGKAFANQKQFWSDFLTLMNSDYLLERRDGLKINVSESEIADAVEGSKNKVQAAISYLLNKGFVFTRYADSFAIASGGATFYRNRVESLVKQGMDRKAAEKQAFEDFRLIAEENQQSSSPMRISQQQRSLIGRIVLQFGNTQLQYVRIQKRAVQDLINGRGDWRSNISKIVYYGAVQNLLFNALQSGLAWAMFDDDEDDDEEEAELTKKNKEQKLERALNGAIDSQLKGLGIQGAVIAGVKNALITIAKEADKKSPKFEEALDDLLSIAPSLGSKIRKIKSAARTVSWNRKEIKEKGFSMDNPAYLAGAQVISAAFNIPLDRAAMKMNNMRNILNPATENWQKVALALGWSTWDVGLPYFGLAEDKPVLTETEKQTQKLFDFNKSDQVKMLLDLGLTKKEIRELKNENNRVKKILELQKTKK